MKRYSDSIDERLTGRHKLCMSMTGDVNGKTILNIGCSIGWFEKYAIDNHCKNVIGIDTNRKSILKAKTSVNIVDFIFSSATDLPFKKESFDIVTMFDVIEHIPKHTEISCLDEIKRVLKNDGRFVLSTPKNSLIGNIFDPAWYLGHRHYSQKKLSRMLINGGFQIDLVLSGGSFFELSSMILLYFFKRVFQMEIPFKSFFEHMREKEYSGNRGFVTIFIGAKK